MQLISVLLQREVVVGLAIAGAIVATYGGYLQRENSRNNPNTARFITRFGYAISWASVAIFIAVGFLSGW